MPTFQRLKMNEVVAVTSGESAGWPALARAWSTVRSVISKRVWLAPNHPVSFATV